MSVEVMSAHLLSCEISLSVVFDTKYFYTAFQLYFVTYYAIFAGLRNLKIVILVLFNLSVYWVSVTVIDIYQTSWNSLDLLLFDMIGKYFYIDVLVCRNHW